MSTMSESEISAMRTYMERTCRYYRFCDTPFYTVVTYLPHYEDNSAAANGFRIFFYMTWLYMMLPMMSADCMPIVYLITMTYKFVTLCQHYDTIKEEFDRDIRSVGRHEAVAKLKAGCLESVIMHQKLMLVPLCRDLKAYEYLLASLLSNAIFYCGWHLCELEKEPHKDIRRLVLIGCTQAQKPLVLKAFGIQDLSYNTFVSVARMTYSVFAVFYQRREL